MRSKGLRGYSQTGAYGALLVQQQNAPHWLSLKLVDLTQESIKRILTGVRPVVKAWPRDG